MLRRATRSAIPRNASVDTHDSDDDQDARDRHGLHFGVNRVGRTRNSTLPDAPELQSQVDRLRIRNDWLQDRNRDMSDAQDRLRDRLRTLTDRNSRLELDSRELVERNRKLESQNGKFQTFAKKVAEQTAISKSQLSILKRHFEDSKCGKW